MQNRFASLLLIGMMLALGSCGSSTSPTIPVWGYFNTVTGTAVLPGHDSTFSALIAQFQNETSASNAYFSVDTVSMNQTILPYFAAPYNYYRIDTTAGLPGDPQFTWHVVGSGSIPSFDNTVTSPMHLRVSYPAPGDTVYALNGFLVEWSPVVTGGTVYLEVDDIHGNTLWPTAAE